MARRTWDLQIRNRPHRIELEHGYFFGRRRIVVDGAEVPIPEEAQEPLPDFGSVHPFEIDGVPCMVVITTNGVTFAYDLAIDGLSHATSKPPVLPVRPAHLHATVWFVYEHPGIVAVLFAIVGLVSAGFGVKVAFDLAARPDVAPRVGLTASSQLEDHAWVTLDGLAVDCASPPIRLDDTRYRLAGLDESGAPVFVAIPNDDCSPDEATGTIGPCGGTHGRSLREFADTAELRVINLDGGPENERMGVIVCSVLALLSFAMAALLGRKPVRLARLAASRRP